MVTPLKDLALRKCFEDPDKWESLRQGMDETRGPRAITLHDYGLVDAFGKGILALDTESAVDTARRLREFLDYNEDLVTIYAPKCGPTQECALPGQYGFQVPIGSNRYIEFMAEHVFDWGGRVHRKCVDLYYVRYCADTDPNCLSSNECPLRVWRGHAYTSPERIVHALEAYVGDTEDGGEHNKEFVLKTLAPFLGLVGEKKFVYYPPRSSYHSSDDDRDASDCSEPDSDSDAGDFSEPEMEACDYDSLDPDYGRQYAKWWKKYEPVIRFKVWLNLSLRRFHESTKQAVDPLGVVVKTQLIINTDAYETAMRDRLHSAEPYPPT